MMWYNNKSNLRFGSIVPVCIVIFQIFLMGSAQLGGLNPICRGIGCDDPPGDARCEIVGPLDFSMPRPSGPRAMCCPLYKCSRSNDAGNFFSFHGLHGAGPGIDGSETVQYTNNGQRSLGASSTATGAHDANAYAGGNAFDMAHAMEEINKAISGFGFGGR